MSEEERIEPQQSQKVEEFTTNGPKTNQNVLDQVKYQYLIGSFKSVSELAERFGINNKSLYARIEREGWEDQRLEKLRQIEKKVDKKAVHYWIERVKERGEKDWNILDRSIDNFGSEVDPDTMLTTVKARKVIDDMVRRAHGLSDSIDVTSKGQSLGESLFSALEKIREKDKTPALTDADCDRILEAEVIEEDKSNGLT